MKDYTVVSAEDGGVTIAPDPGSLAVHLTDLARALTRHDVADALVQVTDAVRHLDAPQRHLDEQITAWQEEQRDEALSFLVIHPDVLAAFTRHLDTDQAETFAGDVLSHLPEES
ncbi:hypothetical protein [Kineococcus radiotolerans]|uniref:Uncharacterized protein n=1 Tax=Kineococcus radiotolerans (strain ATCC BAA-149 / DSM 14245 / SRS30216) TaxID=266940 RepID=A6W8X2_KINRD|nr:hypothetical protein [Kineococcus radiotolerans]ABS03261.1 hypothetical protein Krad_1775 [Kineococcus radiotolerans SRS30216 = ATCC BAA-149]